MANRNVGEQHPRFAQVDASGEIADIGRPARLVCEGSGRRQFGSAKLAAESTLEMA